MSSIDWYGFNFLALLSSRLPSPQLLIVWSLELSDAGIQYSSIRPVPFAHQAHFGSVILLKYPPILWNQTGYNRSIVFLMQCQSVHWVINRLFAEEVRRIQWDYEPDKRRMGKWLKRFSTSLCLLKSTRGASWHTRLRDRNVPSTSFYHDCGDASMSS